MAGRVDAFGGEAAGIGVTRVDGVGEDIRTIVTADIVDQAVANVLRAVPEELRARLRTLWATDTSSSVASLLQMSKATRETMALVRDTGRKTVTVRSGFNAEEVEALTAAYPDFDLRFAAEPRRDHGLGAESRRLDDIDTTMDMPPGMRYADFGANVMWHVHEGHVDCVSVVTQADPHDGTREVQRNMKLDAMASGYGAASPVSREMARSIRDGEGRFLVNSSLQDFSMPIMAGKMTHVYDIPLRDVVSMMERCGMRLFAGTLHFSPLFYAKGEGKLPSIAARYRFDGDKFQMGFVDSVAKWYEHSWTEFRKYGVDQVLTAGNRCYSYAIVKRRGDTIKYRILPMGPVMVREVAHVYRPATLNMVKISGFRLAPDTQGKKDAERLLPDTLYYPAETWDRLVRRAAADAASGRLDFQRLMASYRTYVAGLRYNSVDVGARCVPVKDVNLFVVLAGVVGASEAALVKRTVGGLIKYELNTRMVGKTATWHLLLRSFVDAFKGVAGGTLRAVMSRTPVLRDILSWFGGSDVSSYFKLVSVAQMPKYETVPADSYEKFVNNSSDFVYDGFFFKPAMFQAMERMKEADACMQAISEAAAAAGAASTTVTVEEGPGYTGSDITTVVADTPPSWVPFDVSMGSNTVEYTLRRDAHGVAERTAAISCAIAAATSEAASVEAALARIYPQAVLAGHPCRRALEEHKRLWKDPDLWRVERGLLVQDSECGAPLDNFAHMAVYCDQFRAIDTQGATTGLYLVKTELSEWQGGKRRYRRAVGLEEYTGYVYTSKLTMVYNGPEVLAALKMARDAMCPSETACVKGGPGAGKTYTIRKIAGDGDFLTSPLRASVDDMRAELRDERGWTQRTVSARVRTIDSLLVAASGFATVEAFRAQVGRPSRLIVDEVYCTLPGRVYAVAALLGVQRVLGFGDPRQIPAGVRADYVPIYLQPIFQHEVMCWVVWRMTAKQLAVFNEHYDYKLRTANKKDGVVKVLTRYTPTDCVGSVVHMTMNQADKHPVRQLTKAREVYTTHEKQGATCDTAVLHDVDKRVRVATFDLYNDPAYVTVAASRARTVSLYHKPGGAETLASKWFARAEDPRHVQACGDLSTAGTNYTMVPGWVK